MRAWLRTRAYPMLKGAAEFYRNFPNVKKGADGKYHIHNVNSNESIYGARDTRRRYLGDVRRHGGGAARGGDSPGGRRSADQVARVPGEPGAACHER